MEKRVQVELIERAIRLSRDPECELGDACSLRSVSDYTSVARLEKEREVLLGQFPIVVGFSSAVRESGDFLTHEHTGRPILVARDAEGVLRAFLNVCRHRGAHLLRDACGKGRRSLVCPFHGWTYGLDGALLKVTEAAGFPDVDPARHGLVTLPVAERHGLVFVLPTPGAELDIDRFLGPLFEDWKGLGIADYEVIRPSTRTRRLNWKLHMDATQEIYHLPYLHGSTAGSGYFNNLSLMDWKEPHARIVMPQETVLELEGTPRETWNLGDHAGIVYGIFPNTTALVHSGFVQVLSTFPLDVNTAVLTGGMLVPPGSVSDEASFLRKFHYDTYWETMEEDMSICESLQANMRSGANEAMTFGRREHILGRYHAAIDAALDGRLRP